MNEAVNENDRYAAAAAAITVIAAAIATAAASNRPTAAHPSLLAISLSYLSPLFFFLTAIAR
jgi:hypothetical protein